MTKLNRISIEDLNKVYDTLKKNLPVEENENKEKSIALLWSAGTDSTFLLLYLLVMGYTVTTYYVEIQNNESKTKRELAAIKKIRDLIYKKYPNIVHNWKHYDYPVLSAKLDYDYGVRLNLSQPMFWLMSTISIISDVYGRMPKTYAIGYVNGDDAVYWSDDLKKISDAINLLADPSNRIELVFPLIQIKKSYFWNFIPNDIQKNITWCEAIKPKKNCDCNSCKRHNFDLNL